MEENIRETHLQLVQEYLKSRPDFRENIAEIKRNLLSIGTTEDEIEAGIAQFIVDQTGRMNKVTVASILKTTGGILLSLIIIAGFLLALGTFVVILNAKTQVITALKAKLPPGILRDTIGMLPVLNEPHLQQVQISNTANQPIQTIFPSNDVNFQKNVGVTGGLDVKGAFVSEGVASFNGGITTNGGNLDLGTGSLRASNILYGLTAGNGVSVGNGQYPVITNTGVLSLQNQTGNLALTAGSGISINGLTIANNDLGSSQSIFKNFAVPGQSTIVAGNNNDTLSFVAGSGISLATDSTNKFITITNTGTASGSATGGGWTETTGLITEVNPFDYVGIGTVNPLAPLDIEENVAGIPSMIVNQNGAGDIFTASLSGVTKFNISHSGNAYFSGNLAIATTSAAQTPLQINGISDAYGGGGFMVSDSALAAAANYAAKLTYDSSVLGVANDFRIRIGGGLSASGFGISDYDNAFRFWVNRTGGVGIGTTNPLSSTGLDIEQNGKGNAVLIANNSGGQGDIFTASSSGVAKFVIDKSGNVGIGTTTPQTSLQVNGLVNVYNGGGFQVSDSSLASAANYAAKFTYDSSILGLSNDFRIRLAGASNVSGFGISDFDNAMRFWVNRTGGVGIGTTSPSALFDVAGTASISGQLALYGTPTIQSTSKQTLVLGGNTTGDIQFEPGNSSSSLYLNSNGNVGIATTSAQTALEVNGIIDSYNSGGFQVSDSSLATAANYAAKLTYDSSVLGVANDFRIRIGGGLSASGFGISDYDNAFRFWVNRTGGVGIGTTNPLASTGLDIEQNGLGNSVLVANQLGGGDIFTASQSGSTKFRIDNSGNVTSTGNLAVNGGSITSTQATANIFNTTPTTINFGGNATAINIGANTGSTTIFNNLALNSSTATTTFGGIAYTWPTSGQSNGFVLQTNGSGTLSWVATSATNFWQLNSGVLSPATITNTLAIGQTTALANSGLDIEQNGLGNSVLVANQKGSGDILTASASGSPKFVIKNNGNVGIGITNPNSPLHVINTSSGATVTSLTIGNGAFANNTGTQLAFNLSNSNNVLTLYNLQLVTGSLHQPSQVGA